MRLFADSTLSKKWTVLSKETCSKEFYIFFYRVCDMHIYTFHSRQRKEIMCMRLHHDDDEYEMRSESYVYIQQGLYTFSSERMYKRKDKTYILCKKEL